jgi:hypothetical protein
MTMMRRSLKKGQVASRYWNRGVMSFNRPEHRNHITDRSSPSPDQESQKQSEAPEMLKGRRKKQNIRQVRSHFLIQEDIDLPNQSCIVR